MTTPVVLVPGLGPESYAPTLAHPDLAKALVLVAPSGDVRPGARGVHPPVRGCIRSRVRRILDAVTTSAGARADRAG